MKQNKHSYEYLWRNATLKLTSSSGNSMRPVAETMPIEQIERHYLQDTDTLIGLLDGSITDEDCEQSYPNKMYKGPTDEVIYLDKSARNIYLLVHGLWSELSDGIAKKPKANFLNIDKEEYLQYMGFGINGENLQDIDTDMVDIDRIDKDALSEMLVRIRCLYLNPEDFGKIDEDNLQEAWNLPTRLDGKNIAIVDEVKSSGNTLNIALQLLKRAFPNTNFNGYYWSAPPILRWRITSLDGVTEESQFAVARVPVWYDAETSRGRGIDDKNNEFSGQSKYKFQRIGKYILSIPYLDPDTGDVRKTIEPVTAAVRSDLKKLVKRFKSKEVHNFVPSGLRAYDDFEQKIEKYYGITYTEWIKLVRQK